MRSWFHCTCNRFLPSLTACSSGKALIAFLSITLRSLSSRSIRDSRGNPSNAPSRNSRMRFLTSFSSSKDERLLNVSGDRMFSLLKLKSRTRRAVKPCSDPGNSVKVLCEAYSSRRSLQLTLFYFEREIKIKRFIFFPGRHSKICKRLGCQFFSRISLRKKSLL